MISANAHAIPTGEYQLMPPLTEDEFTLLKLDIQTHGVLVPIELDDQGNILDGHHRLAAVAALEAETPNLRIPYETVIRRNLTPAQKKDYVIALNLKRRHLSDLARASLFLALRASGRTLTDIADLAGSSTTTVWRRIQEAEAATTNPTSTPAYTLGRDGKLRPTTYSPASYMSHTELVKEERTLERATTRSTPPADFPAQTDAYNIFRDSITNWSTPTLRAQIPDHSLDLILTDPPYPYEYVHLMGDLSAFAARTLKPGAPLVAMLGHAYLPQYIELLQTNLRYHWTIANILGGANSVQHVWSAFVGWKPILVFVNSRNSDIKPDFPYYFLDIIKSPGPDKTHHIWGQDVSTFQLLVYRFTRPGATVCDPFLGGGTTAIAALSHKRRFIGFDNDPVAINTTLQRLRDTDWSQPLLATPPVEELLPNAAPD